MSTLNSCLYECTVLHHRFAPKTHRFVYRIFLFAFDLDELPELNRRLPLFSHNRANVFSFRDADFLPTAEPLHHPSSPEPSCNLQGCKAPSLKARVVTHLATQGVDLAGGRVVLVTLPRIFGYLFNPVSFYFCYDRTGACVASLAEVTNTFKEMKPYFLGPETRTSTSADSDTPKLSTLNSQLSTSDASASVPLATRPSPLGGAAAAAFHRRTPKHFYVSPFSDVDVAFDFTLRTPQERLSIQIDDYVGADRTLTSTLAGPRRPLTSARLAWFTLKYPLLTLRIIALIHWHAARLWLRRLPWFAKAGRPVDQRDLYRPHSSLAPRQPGAAAPAIPISTEVA